MINKIMEETFGDRLTMNYIVPSVVMFDLHTDFVRKVKEFLALFKSKIHEYDELVTGNVIFQSRTQGVGVHTGRVRTRNEDTGMGTVGTDPGAARVRGASQGIDELCIPTRIAEHGRSIRAGIGSDGLECEREQERTGKRPEHCTYE